MAVIRINEIIDRILEYKPEADVALVQKAYVWSAKYHAGSLRESGLPYLSHPLEVAGILAELKLPEASIAAGLLHDLCKGMGASDMLEAARRYGIALTDAQRSNPGLLHGPLAAKECRRALGIRDDAVYEAIYWHTTGHPGLGPLALALYLADFAEPLRTRS